ncbi:hypothetical protein [Noviherbaspirillum galbum]|uniref:Uncharacterized protein n=1 Tax=Noviherbaspirillum galbum TaxID=2709383 RepID=A0A6B3SYA5_9BURK|nr:hypothetical protein [Noviherbaspirillum galbum]NEX64705.1 hypothetical protein [Noviherbaspirillum galbum]
MSNPKGSEAACGMFSRCPADVFRRASGAAGRQEGSAGDHMENMEFLFDYEREALLEALRRDLRNSERKAMEAQSTSDAEYHAFNSRFVARLLEILNPKAIKDAAFGPDVAMSGR